MLTFPCPLSFQMQRCLLLVSSILSVFPFSSLLRTTNALSPFSSLSSFPFSSQSTQCQRRKNTSRKSSSLALSFLSLSVKHIHAHKNTKHSTQARERVISLSLSLSHHTVDAHEDASSWHQFSFFLPECSTVLFLFIFVSAPPVIFVRSWKKCVASALSCFPLKFLFLFLRFSWGLFVGVS